MAHVVSDKGEQPEGDDRGKPVLDDVALGAVAAVDIDGQRDRDRKRRGGARERGHEKRGPKLHKPGLPSAA